MGNKLEQPEPEKDSEFTYNLYLLNYAWEGYCRTRNLTDYEVAPFTSEDPTFCQLWWNKLMRGRKFDHVAHELAPPLGSITVPGNPFL